MGRASSYWRVGIRVPAEQVDDIAALLMAHGALGCAVQGKDALRRGGSRVLLEAFFKRLTSSQLRNIRKILNNFGVLQPFEDNAKPQLSKITDPGWATSWKERFRPIKIGKRLLIAPPWDKPFAQGRISILIEPGQAFGTGTHPTTASMLREIEIELAEHLPETALDVGTGSGILAIALKLLGVKDVTGIDIDRSALENARHNAKLNGIDKSLNLLHGDIRELYRTYDLIVANIDESTLRSLYADIRRLLPCGGRAIVSGILTRQADAIVEQYTSNFELVRRRLNRGWATLVFQKR